MLSCPATLCVATFEDAKKLSQHKSRYHATPILVMLEDGTERKVINLPTGGYVCWCDRKFDIRESCTEHVRTAHLPKVPAARIFAKSKSKLYHFILM